MIYHLFDLHFINSAESKKLPDDGRPLPKHVGACILNKGMVQFSACVGCFATYINIVVHRLSVVTVQRRLR
jgi:hypothetical protein